MGGGILIPVSFFLFLFATIYLYFTTRNKERMALIEKGADASIFVRGKNQKTAPVWKVLVLNLALLLMGIGAGIVFGGILQQLLNEGREFGNRTDFAMPGTIFLMAGTGLLIGFFLTKKMDKED